MGQVYLLTFPVSDKQEARNLGSSSAWEVLEELREVGLDGMTVEEISKKLDLPKSTVYEVLSKLQAARWVEPRRSSRKIGRPNAKRKAEINRTGRMKQIYVEKIPWGDSEFDENFKDVLDPAIARVLEKHGMVDSFVDALDKILASLALGEKSKKFLPSRELCPKCKSSHEADEFLQAICIGLTSALLSDDFSDKIKPVLEKHGVNAFSAY